MEIKPTSRRSFVLHGGALLGAGLATAGAATPRAPADARSTPERLEELQRQLDGLGDRHAVLRVHQTFMTSIEKRDYEAAADLFVAHAFLDLSGLEACGKPAIRRLLTERYRQQTAAVIHSAYRATRTPDTVSVSEDRLQASATFRADVEVSTPLQPDCTAAQMARLQGQMADRRWETGCFEARYVRTGREWKIASLAYSAS